MPQRVLCFILLLFTPALSNAQEAMRLPVDVAPLIVHTDKGKVHFDVEIARTEEQRERGLMYRRDFPANRAMIFRFPQERLVTMWMENTPLPLDMVFVNSSGQIISVHKNARPFSQTLISSRYPVSFVIELNAGEIDRQGIFAGQSVVHPVICGACGE